MENSVPLEWSLLSSHRVQLCLLLLNRDVSAEQLEKQQQPWEEKEPWKRHNSNSENEFKIQESPCPRLDFSTSQLLVTGAMQWPQLVMETGADVSKLSWWASSFPPPTRKLWENPLLLQFSGSTLPHFSSPLASRRNFSWAVEHTLALSAKLWRGIAGNDRGDHDRHELL